MSLKTPYRTILAQKYITIHPRGKALNSGQREIVLTVFGNLLVECPDVPIKDIYERTAILTGTSRATVERIKQAVGRGEPLSTPGKKRPRAVGTRTRMVKCDDFTKIGIRRIVHEMFRLNKPPTLEAVTGKIKDDDSLPTFSKRSVHRYLTDLGFTYERRNRKSVLIERDDLIAWRRKYLRNIRHFRTEGRPIFYLDESYLNAGHTVSKAWQPSYIKSAKQAFQNGETTGLKSMPGRGGRLIIAHIGNEEGFLKPPANANQQEDARLIFQAKKKTLIGDSDYHEEMTGACFEDWFRTVLPMLPPHSVIVMDNATYHSRKKEKFPTMKWKKIDIQNYLMEKNVHWNPTEIKAELIQKAAPFRPHAEKYIVDEMAVNAGHNVLRLPPYHCDLNPIELAWAQIKNNVARHNVTYNIRDVEALLNENINTVTADDWRKFIEHVKKIEDQLWQTDDIVDFFLENHDDLIITVNNNTGSETSEESENEEMLAEPLLPT